MGLLGGVSATSRGRRQHSTQHSKLIVPPMSPLLPPSMPARCDVIVCEKPYRGHHPIHCWLKLLLRAKYAVLWQGGQDVGPTEYDK